ncbi:hypothetical protein, conserved [Eimeria necatrix]|uniref:Single-stranded DNA binding protein Ssb-like OB fold domain-containing protein n=1 Tax=Eimeria necatrix TaxID=51315 RepID=U6MS22_9EIME|nr:hypothetical protein, conserved [Eimeria necatrix]CDJ65264.1 hypothetical protein, conserved [Eimeria necatrix]
MAESFTVESTDAASSAFTLNSGPYRNIPIYVHLAKGLPADAWEQVHTNPLFGEWAANLCHEGRLKADRITIQQVKPEICMNVEATTSQGTSVSGPVVLRPMQSAILIVLRNSVTNLELCVFCKRPELATGLSESLGLVEGNFDAEGKLEGPCAALLEKHLGLSLHKDDCVDLLIAAHGRVVGDSGVTCIPSSAATAEAPPAVRSRLLLYRSVATPEVLQKLEQEVGRTKRHGYPPATVGSAQEGEDLLGLSVVYMGDTWRATLDPRAVFALFLLVEFRYHQLKLPKAPRFAAHDGKGAILGAPRRGEAASSTALGAPSKKAAAQFRKISSLTPLCTGVNLRVKVVEPIKPAPDVILPRGQVIKRATMVVGDDEAMITLNLEGVQLELPDVVNTPLLIRNAKIQMEEGHMRLAVDRWGKISDARNDDFKDFNFSVCTARDMSEQEYELVHMPGSEQDAAEGPSGRAGSPPFAGRGRNGMRGRGRGGFRGGRGRRGI